MLHLFDFKSDMKTKATEDNVAVFKELQKFPEAQKKIADQLVVPDFLVTKFAEFSDKIKEHNSLLHMIQMIATFNKETQSLFYQNLVDAMSKYDNMQAKF